MSSSRQVSLATLMGISMLASACLSATPTPTPTSAPTPTPSATSTPTLAPTPTSTPIPPPTPTQTPVEGATTVSIPASQDTTLYDRGTLPAANGSGDHLFFGSTNGNEARRALVAFDVAASIPAGATIASAKLTLTISRSRSDAGGDPSSVHRVETAWGEGTSNSETAGEGSGTAPEAGDATWLHRIFPDIRWTTAGGDFVAQPSATANIGTPPRGQVLPTTWGSTEDLVADAQAWLDDPGTNHGWIILGSEGTRQTAKRANSRENPEASARPVLVIEYFP